MHTDARNSAAGRNCRVERSVCWTSLESRPPPSACRDAEHDDPRACVQAHASSQIDLSSKAEQFAMTATMLRAGLAHGRIARHRPR
jgi:hypothetical protein